jgi:hypothetical protein
VATFADKSAAIVRATVGKGAGGPRGFLVFA